jgi:hypothetical protein
MACSLLAFSSWFSSWACPSPPGLAASCLSFSSWAWSWASVHPHGFAGWFLVLKWCCVRTVMFLVMFPYWSNESCFSWLCSSSRLLDLQAAVVLPAPASQSCDWAACVLCACLPHSVRSHPPAGRAVKLLCTHLFCTPINNRTDSTLGPFVLSDAIGNLIAPCLRVTYSNTNPLLVFYFLLF